MPDLDAPRAVLDLPRSLAIQARANRLANRRLQEALGNLSTAELHARRTSFFPTLIGTLNHLLAVDLFYIAALHGEADMDQQYRRFAPHDDLSPYVSAQERSDQRLIAFCDRLDAAGCNAVVEMRRGDGVVQRDLAGHVLQHLFMHQTHHRGQVHAMLAGTAVKPPQLDEFLMPSDAQYRVRDMAALGWSERELYGPA
ncbi:MAG TPA: DinB family protein [Burkholderiaceae bacterium]